MYGCAQHLHMIHASALLKVFNAVVRLRGSSVYSLLLAELWLKLESCWLLGVQAFFGFCRSLDMQQSLRECCTRPVTVTVCRFQTLMQNKHSSVHASLSGACEHRSISVKFP